MKCAYCTKPLRWWQSSQPLGCGYLTNTFGQREHDECSDARKKILETSTNKKMIEKAVQRINEREYRDGTP